MDPRSEVHGRGRARPPFGKSAMSLTEHRHDDGQAKEHRERADDQRNGDNQAPECDCERIGARHPQRSLNRRHEAEVATSIRGNETTLIASASAAKQKPINTPTKINVHPRPVVRTSRKNGITPAGALRP